ncbi:unnamed protein product, partial [Brenthis ino]
MAIGLFDTVMSGGRLIVLDRLGRDVKAFPLEEGLATIGSDPVCDIRVMLPTVSPHHATVVVHTNQTVVRSESAGETLVNGAAVSVAALRHGDELTVGGRTLRWEYNDPNKPRPLAPQPALARRAARSRARRRVSAPSARAPLAPPHRASMPSSSSGKQVAIVQPQRRDTNDQNLSGASPRGKRARDADDAAPDAHARSPAARLPGPTKASLWIESRKPAPLRLAALRRAHSHSHARVHKIQAPAVIDHTKQAAIMLMAGHTPRPKQPSLAVKRPSPVRKTPNKRSAAKAGGGSKSIGATPRRASTYSSRSSAANKTTTILEITDSDTPTTRQRNMSRRSARKTSLKSPVLPSPKKSSLKDPSTKKTARRTESIKFDLSNLESNTTSPNNRSSEVLLVTNTTQDRSDNSASEDDLTLHYSDSSTRSPSPRKSIHSRSSKMLEKSLGATFTHSPSAEHSALTPESPRARKSSRGSLILQKALDSPDSESSRFSRRSTKTMSDQSYNTVTSARKTRTFTPRTSQNVEAYSIVDLVSIDSNESQQSLYNSIDSNSTSANYDTPQTLTRKTRSTNLLGSSTPYNDRPAAVDASPETSKNTINSISRVSTRRYASMTTPENSQNITFNSTKISKVRSSRSRINDSDILLVDDDNDSPKSSRGNKSNVSTPVPKSIAVSAPATPPRRAAPLPPATPVLRIQRLLDQSASSHTSIADQSQNTRRNPKRKTIAGNISENKKLKLSIKSRSLNMTSRRSLRARKSPPSFTENQVLQNVEVVTPKSAVKLVQEGVKNKHSTAKKPTSKRSIIDNLDESDFVKQLFNSPVKRKLSQSITEFSRKQLFEDEEAAPARRARRTVAGGSPDTSLIELGNNGTATFTPDVFVSPLSSPGNSPNLSGIRRLFRKDTPENDLRDVRGVKSLLRTPRNKKAVQDDLTNVSGVKKMFASSPKNDLRRVSGVKALFQTGRKGRTPKNTLEDVRGVKNLFRNSPRNDLRNVSGVKKGLRVNSPRNDLTDVRGVKQLYREQGQKNYLSDISGLEELFYEPSNLDSTFDQLMGKPRVRSYAKANSFTKVVKPARQARNAKSLHDSINQITNNVEEWLENELKKRMETKMPTPKKSISIFNSTRELQKLTTDTVEGNTPLRSSRVRNSTLNKIQLDVTERQKSASEVYSAHTLPIKKRSLVNVANKSGNEPKNKLPIKKRTVVHSTPVKGAANATMNASELGRVSPIAPVDGTDDITAGTLQPPKESPKRKPTRGRKIKLPEIPNPEALLQPSPHRTRAKRSEPSPVPARATRGRKTKEITITNTKKRRSSIVITKKPPVLTPKSNLKTKQDVQIEETNVVRPRATRQKPEARPKVATPKKTRSKKVTLVVSKQSPQLKPRSTRSTKSEVAEEVKEVKTRRSRKTTVNTTNDTNVVETQPELGTRRGRKTEVKPIEAQQPLKRGRRNVTVEEPKVEISNRGRRTRAKTETQSSVEAEAEKSTNRRTRKTQEKVETKEIAPNKRSRRVQEKVEELGKAGTDVKETRTRGRKAKDNAEVSDNKGKVAKGKAVEAESVEVVPRGRRGAGSDKHVEVKGKGKKDTKKDKEGNAETKKTRNTVKELKIEITRVKEAAVEKEAPEAPKVERGRKRKTAIEEPAKDAVVETNKRRATRALAQAEATRRTASRGRRR